MAAEREVVWFDGHPYYRYPQARQRSHRVYFSPGGKGAAAREALHREVYKKHHGPIPDGCDVHHADGDPLNNDPSNLVAVTRTAHRGGHGNPMGARAAEHLAAIAPLAAAWHATPEGRAWHSEHGRRTWEGRPERAVRCVECGETFLTRYAGSNVQLCSRACRNRQLHKNPRYHEDRRCVECGATFTAYKYAKTTFCSRSCAGKAKARKRWEKAE